MKKIPLITGVCGLILVSIGLLGLFVEGISKDDGALLVAGTILFSAAQLNWRGHSN
jgi:hypothetical protein